MDKTAKTIAVSILCAAPALIWCVAGRGCASELAYPAENGANWFSRNVGVPLKGMMDGAAAASEAERLRRENARLAIAATENEALRRENARLEKVLYGAERLKPYGDWVCAPVLSRGGALGARRMIRAGRGSRDGVKPGAAAAVPEGLAGRVVSVSPHACEILLLSDETFRVSCVFETENGECVYGILSGGGASPAGSGEPLSLVYADRAALLKNLPAQTPPRDGDRILASGLGGVFPPGIPVGRVVSTRPAGAGTACEAEIAPFADFDAMREIFIAVEGR